jgi:hypothetical protein
VTVYGAVGELSRWCLCVCGVCGVCGVCVVCVCLCLCAWCGASCLAGHPSLTQSAPFPSPSRGLAPASGMTNAGKTFTVLGTDLNPGLLPRAVADVVDAVAEANLRQSHPGGPRGTGAGEELPDLPRTPLPTLLPGESLSVTMSCLEVYNDQVFDALVPPPTDPTMTRPILKVKDGLGGR